MHAHEGPSLIRVHLSPCASSCVFLSSQAVLAAGMRLVTIVSALRYGLYLLRRHCSHQVRGLDGHFHPESVHHTIKGR